MQESMRHKPTLLNHIRQKKSTEKILSFELDVFCVQIIEALNDASFVMSRSCEFDGRIQKLETMSRVRHLISKRAGFRS